MSRRGVEEVEGKCELEVKVELGLAIAGLGIALALNQAVGSCGSTGQSAKDKSGSCPFLPQELILRIQHSTRSTLFAFTILLIHGILRIQDDKFRRNLHLLVLTDPRS